MNLRLIEKIDYEIENEDKINDGVIDDIKRFFNRYLEDNTHYHFNVKTC